MEAFFSQNDLDVYLNHYKHVGKARYSDKCKRQTYFGPPDAKLSKSNRPTSEAELLAQDVPLMSNLIIAMALKMQALDGETLSPQKPRLTLDHSPMTRGNDFSRED